MNWLRLTPIGCLWLCLLLAHSGCGPRPVAVQGGVTLGGQPLDEAVIVFVPQESGRKQTGAPIVNGSYQIAADDGLLPGAYNVRIIDDPPLSLGHDQSPAGQAALARRRKLPEKYGQNSPLKVEIPAEKPAEGALTFDFEL